MGLYINNSEHPDVYINDGEMLEPNQAYYKYEPFSEMIKEQMKINNELTDSYGDLKALYQRQDSVQANRWIEIGKQLNRINENNLEHKKFERQTMEWLQTLDKNNGKLQGIMESGDHVNQEIIQQINELQKSNAEIYEKLERYESTGEQLTPQIKELIDANQQLTEQVTGQDNMQENMLTRLENQEALMEKTMRQLNNFRSILFERTNHLAEKIENSYDMTSSYVYKLMTRSDRPLTLYVDQKKAEKESE